MAYPSNATIWSTSQERITKALYDRKPLPNVAYIGTTTNATPTEIFLYNETDARIQPPEDSVLMMRFDAIARVNSPDTNAAHFIGRSAFSVIRYATTLEIEGTNAFIDVATTGNPATQAVIGTASHVAFTVDNTNDRMVLTVTGLAATTINWFVELKEYTCLSYPLKDYQGILN